MTGGNSNQAWEKLVLWSAAILLFVLIICPLAAILITGTADTGHSPEGLYYHDIYQKNGLEPPFWPLENNFYGDISEEEMKKAGGYLDDYRCARIAARINFGACKAIFIDMGDFVHEIVFFGGNTTEYDLAPELMAEEVTILSGGDDLTAGYRIYRVYPEFPVYYNADTPYIDFTDVWGDSSISCIAGDIVRSRTAGRFYQNTNGKIANVLDMTEATKASPLVYSKEKRKSSGSWNYIGEVSFEGEYTIESIPVRPDMYIDSRVTSGPGNDAGIFSFSSINLSSSVGILGLLFYFFMLAVSGDRVLKFLKERRKDQEKADK